MTPSAQADPTPELSLLLVLEGPPGPDIQARLAALSLALPEAEVCVFGHGDPDLMAFALRELAAVNPSAWVEVATRPMPPAEALVQGVRGCETAWVLLLPARAQPGEAASAQAIWRDHAGDALAGDPARGPCLFRRDVLLRLPRIPGMPALLPELFRQAGARTSCEMPVPDFSARLRRAYVAVACRMGLGRIPPCPTA